MSQAARALAVALATAALGAVPADAKIDGFAGEEIASGDSVMTGRLSQNGVDSSCATPKSTPATAEPSGSFLFDRRTFTNDGPGRSCVHVAVDGSDCGGSGAVHGAAYQPTFTGNPSAGYKADFGSNSSLTDGAKIFSFLAAPGDFDVIVRGSGTSGQCSEYSVLARVAPSARTDPATGVNRTAATLAGSINEESEPTTYHFDFGTTGTYSSQTNEVEADGGGTTTKTVASDLTNLQPDTVYHYRIVVTYPAFDDFPGGTVLGADQSFRTAAAPTATTAAASGVTTSAATLNGAVNPGGGTTTARFQFGKSTAYGSESPTQAVGSDRADHALSASLFGLQPDTTYHYRVVATQGTLVITSGDATFKTPPVTPPPASGDTGGGATGGSGDLGGAGDAFPAAPAQPAAPAVDALAPAFTAQPRLAPRTFAAASRGPSVVASAAQGTVVSYSLSEPAQVAFTVQRAAPGRRARGGCRKPSARNRSGKRCTRFVRVTGSFTHSGATGANRFRFTGRVGGRKLAPGTYRLAATATDPAGNRSSPKRAGFKIR
jgi:hypothetical protein